MFIKSGNVRQSLQNSCSSQSVSDLWHRYSWPQGGELVHRSERLHHAVRSVMYKAADLC